MPTYHLLAPLAHHAVVSEERTAHYIDSLQRLVRRNWRADKSPRAALGSIGFSAVSDESEFIRIKLANLAYDFVNQTPWLFDHSGMKIPSDEVFEKSYEEGIIRPLLRESGLVTMSPSNKKIMGIGAFALILMAWGALSWKSLNELEPVTALSVSSDGRYVISAHEDGVLVLWDVEHQKREVLSDDANIYSAYFIGGSDAFLWQDQNDVVHVQRVDGEVIEEFEHFPTYGHVMDSTFSDYLASDERWNIFHGHGDAMQPVMQDGIIPSFVGSGKILKITLSEQGRKFVSAGSGDRESPSVDEVQAVAPERRFSNYTGVTLWDLDTFQPIAMLPGNSFKVDATISLDGEWVVSGDENTLGFFWNTHEPQERHRLADYLSGVFLEDVPDGLETEEYWDKSSLIEVPRNDSPNEHGVYGTLATPTTISLAFINGSEEFLRIGYSQYQKDGSSRTYAALFEAGNPWPQAYLDLGTNPFPSINNYSRNLSIDSAPDANLLVTGHAFDGGITVYRYDPEERTLAKEWVGQ